MRRQSMRSGFTAVLLMLSSLSVAAAPDSYDRPMEDARLVGTLHLDGELFHVQGLEVDGPRLWVTSVDHQARRAFVHAFDRRSGRFLQRLELTDGARYHPGGISITGRSIWVPVAEMRPESSAMLVEIDADSLAIRRRIRVADHVGFVAASGERLVAGNWDSRLLYLIDLSEGIRARAVANPSQTHFQDMKFVGDQLVGGGYRTLWSGTVDWIDWRTMTVQRSLRAGAVGRIRPFGRGGPYTGEGLAIAGRNLFVLPEDGPSRVFHFRLDD